MSVLYSVALHYGHISGTIKQKEKICCPFHADDTPSMVLDYTQDRFYCFGCGIYGDVMDYVQGMEGNGVKALLVYAKITKGIESHERKWHDRRRQDSESLAQAYDFYFGLSKVDWYSVEREKEQERALQYLLERGVDVHTIARYDIKVTYEQRYPIVIPLYDNGTFCGYVQRTFYKQTERKYLYNKGFSRATSLVGFYGERCDAFVCEGIFDLMALTQTGLQGYSVALMGCNPTREQIAKLKDKGIKRVISCLDNDEAGGRGTEELQRHFKVKRLVLPYGVKDIAELENNELKKTINKLMKK